jgi:glycerol-3-phosphate dehydrogenase
MQKEPARDSIWSSLDHPWDLIIIGGGITGAGILREATRAGLQTLLLEANDFASGTSSRSSKLVHGGLRYLKNAQIKTTLESVTERERLLRQGRGLINRLGFLYTSLEGDKMPAWVFGMGLVIYDLMARQWTHRSYDTLDMREFCPLLTTPALKGGYRYFDAITDDARLVLRVIQEATQEGGTALNYARVIELLHDRQDQVCGVVVQNQAAGQNGSCLELQARAVVNATGAWAEVLRPASTERHQLRPLRGSHLIFPGNRIPLTRAVSLLHPRDGRPVFLIPWEGVTIFGTTDIDHPQPETETCISVGEIDYLLEAIQHIFPELELGLADIQATYSGVRPVISSGKRDPSKEARDYILWVDQGLVTVAGGKLTTFRLMARDTLRLLRRVFPQLARFDPDQPVLNSLPDAYEAELQSSGLSPAARLRLAGRYGGQLSDLVAIAQPGEFYSIAGTQYSWAELRWAASQESVVHLDDLLLRRVRLGLLLPGGGVDCLSQIRAVAQPELGWDDRGWLAEEERYVKLWQKCYNVPHCIQAAR